MRPWTNKYIGLGALGLLLNIIGAFLYFFSPCFWPALFSHILQKEMPLGPTSRAFEAWNDTSKLPPMYLKIYFFNWTNPEEISVRGTKPNLVQLGPYVFREIRQKANVVFHPENDTVSYLQRRIWYFEPALSNGSLSDNVTQVNAVAISAAHKIRYWQDVMQNTLSFMLSAYTVHVTKTVDELLFTGYDDNLIRIGRLAAMDDDVPPFDRFGWFYMRNGTTIFDGHFNMDTGASNISNFGVVRNWNYKDTTKFFRSPCNVVEGSAGEFWSPNQQKDQIIYFSADLCRPLFYEYAETTYHNGVEGYRYVLGDKTLGNNTKRRYPHEHAKYFEPTTTTEDFFDAEPSAEVTDPPEEDPDVVNIGNCYCNGQCTPTGLLNISACRYGTPIFVSLPHFHRADPHVRNRVSGMNPTDDDDFFITLEPTTGVPLKVSAKLQINILLQPSKTVSLFKSVPTVYFPVLWFSMEVETGEEYTDELKQLLSLPSLSSYAGAIMVIAGSLVIFTVALLYLLNRRRTNALANDKNMIPRGLIPATSDKSEMMYLDKGSAIDDTHVRSDRKLYPNTVELFNMDLQSFPPKVRRQSEQKSEIHE